MKTYNSASFDALAHAIVTLGIPVNVLYGVLALVGDTGTVTSDVLYQAWTAYQQSPAFKSFSGSGLAQGRQAS